jgi:hypothetical protein
MIVLIAFVLFIFAYVIFFFADRKKALLTLFLIKLPFDQVAWKYSIPVGLTQLRVSEAFTVFITLLLLVTFLLDKTRDSNRKGFFRHIPSMILIPMIIFMIVYFVYIFRGWWVGSLQLFFKLITGIVVGTYVAKTLKTEEEINWLLRCMLFSTVIISILSMPAIYSGGELHVYAPSSENKFVGTQIGGGVGKYYAADSFAHAFIVNIPAILFASAVLKSKWEKILCLSVSVFAILAVFAAAIRAGWISLSLILIFWMIVRRQWKLILISVFCVFIVGTAQFFSNPLQRAYQKIALEANSLEKGELPPEYAFGGRPLIWKTYIGYYMNASLLDKIIGNDNILYMGLAKTTHDTHNDFLTITLKMGIIGLSATLFLYIWTSVCLLKANFSIREPYSWNLALSAILSLLSMMVPAFTRTGLMNPNYQWVFWTLAMITLKRYILSKSILPQSESSLSIDENSESIVSEIT